LAFRPFAPRPFGLPNYGDEKVIGLGKEIQIAYLAKDPRIYTVTPL
jgi:hypothetical protein